MGITGLLPLLKPVTKDVHISELKGLTVGIDTYCWLHKGIYSCSAELCQGLPTDKFIKFCVERVHLLLSHGVQPYLVFDGGYLPAKAGKEEERRAKRESNLQRGIQLMREGNASGAHQFFCKAADVTPFMAHQVIQVMKRIPGVRYVVAPYEADAQLGFLARNGHVDAVITEDSDIMLFGCNRVIFKLERDGTGQEVNLGEVFSRRNDELDMRGMNEDDLMTLCALSGCDYLPSVHGMGLKKAYRMVSRHKELPKILRAVKFDSGGAFPHGYEADFQRALLTFRHQRAFDPVSRSVVHMTPLPESLPPAILAPTGNGESRPGLEAHAAALAFLGPPVAQERGCAVADGDVDPITGQAFSEMGGEGVDHGSAKTPKSTLSEAAAAALAAWRGNPTPTSGGSAAVNKKQLSAQGNNLTKYWGAPVSSKKFRVRDAAGGRGGGGGGGVTADRSFELETPDGPPRKPSVLGGERAAYGAEEATGDRPDVPAKEVEPDRSSPASLQSCVSPGSFYSGVSESPSSPVASTSGATFDDVDATAREGKENRAPLSPPREDVEPPEETNDLPASSKFFGGRGGGGVGGKGLPVRQSGLLRRFRTPYAAPRPAASAAALRGSALRGGQCSGVGEAKQDDDNDVREPDPWGAEYAYPRLDASRATAGSDQRRPAGLGRSGSVLTVPSSGGVGRGLKRRRTLGVGSLVPNGLIRGLEGAPGGGLGGPGRRSKSLGATAGDASSNLETAGANDNGSSDVDDDDDDNADGITGDHYVSNLFERFAARVPTRSPDRKGDVRDQPEPRETTRAAATAAFRIPGTGSGGGAAGGGGRGGEATAAANEHLLAIPDSGAYEGEETEGGDVGAQNTSFVVVAQQSLPPSSRSLNSPGNRVCPAAHTSPAGPAGGGDGFFYGYRASSGGKNNNPERRYRAGNFHSKRGKGGGAGDRKTTLIRKNAATTEAVAAAVRTNRGGAGKVEVDAGDLVGVTPHIFEQFAYSSSD